MQPILDNPFRAVEAAVMKMRSETPNIIVDAHGETTSEKIALGRFLDGKVSAVIGTHTHVQTADEQIFPGGTAFLCDAGMCGPVNSILGRAVDPIMNRFISNLPSSFPVAGGEVRLRGALVEIDETTGRAVGITRVDEPGPSASVTVRSGAKDRYRKCAITGTDLKLLNLQPTIHASRFELSKEYQRLIEIYEQILCFCFNRGFDPLRFTGMPGSGQKKSRSEQTGPRGC